MKLYILLVWAELFGRYLVHRGSTDDFILILEYFISVVARPRDL